MKAGTWGLGGLGYSFSAPSPQAGLMMGRGGEVRAPALGHPMGWRRLASNIPDGWAGGTSEDTGPARSWRNPDTSFCATAGTPQGFGWG